MLFLPGILNRTMVLEPSLLLSRHFSYQPYRSACAELPSAGSFEVPGPSHTPAVRYPAPHTLLLWNHFTQTLNKNNLKPIFLGHLREFRRVCCTGLMMSVPGTGME